MYIYSCVYVIIATLYTVASPKLKLPVFNWSRTLPLDFFLKKEKRDHVTLLLKALHWLPVQFRIHFQILLFVFKSLHNQAPIYLSELLHQYIPSRSLRSCEQNLLLIPHSRLKRSDRAFSVIGPCLWNDLPVEIRMAHSLTIFKSLLKTHLFSLLIRNYNLAYCISYLCFIFWLQFLYYFYDVFLL